MKKAALAGIAALTLLDISASTPVEAQTPNPFAGFYVGGDVGWFSGDANFMSAPYNFVTPGDTFALPGRNDSFDFEGELVSVHGGYNFVTTGNVLIGVEADWMNLDEKDTVTGAGGGTGIVNTDGFVFEYQSELELDWQATIRGRLGFVAGNWMVFSTAGIAFIDVNWHETGTLVNTTATQTFTSSHSASDTLTGYVLGGGIANAIGPNLIVRVDGLYENFEDWNNVPHGFGPPLQTGTIKDLEVYKVRVGASFRFNNPFEQ